MKQNVFMHLILLTRLFLILYANGNASKSSSYTAASFYDNPNTIEETVDNPESNSTCKTVNKLAYRDTTLGLCKPAPLQKVSEQILQRKAYIVSYNKDTRQPNWVAWHLTGEHSDGVHARPSGNAFHEDEEVAQPRASLEDYRGSGWSRGHMCPAGDNKWDATAMYESFLLTNVCPQDSRLNSGLWNSVEIDCRRWAKQFGDIYIVCGPVFYRQEHERIGENWIPVPEAFFKVVLCLNGKPKGLGIVVKNNAGTKKSDLYYNSIDQVERITGMDFFPALPDDIENSVESKSDINEWN